MAYNPQNGTAGTPVLADWPIWPDESVRGVIEDAHAVEREARRLERESGGHPLIGAIVSFRAFRDAVQMLSQMCQALQDEELTPEQRLLLDDVAPKIAALSTEIDGSAPVVPTFRELLSAATDFRDMCEELAGTELTDDQREFLTAEVRPPIDNLITAIQNFMQPPLRGQPERGASGPPPRGERK
jgi:hypothetical protein